MPATHLALKAEQRILLLRGQKVMLDFHLAELYAVETRALKQAVRRNPDRFPADFMFELNADEAQLLVSQNVIPGLGPEIHSVGSTPFPDAIPYSHAPPVTPGEILLKEYLQPMGISQNAMARAIGVPPRAINEIVLGKRSITPSMSIRFGVFFGQSDTFWHGIQVECDFRALARQRNKLISGIQPAQSITSAA